VANAESDNVSILLNRGDATFLPPVNYDLEGFRTRFSRRISTAMATATWPWRTATPTTFPSF